MNITALQTFLAIVETGSLARASEQMNVTQSTVTARLQSLEQELDQQLIVRQKSGARMTASGQRLKRTAEVMTQLWRQARQETALPERISEVCNIGCQHELWSDLGERLTTDIRTMRPNAALSAWPGNASELTAWLAAGLIDVALTHSATVQQNQQIFPIGTEDLILVSTDAAAPLRFDPGYVFVEGGEEFGRAHAAAYSDAASARLSFGSATWGLAHILGQGGSAYLPARMVAPYIETGQLHRLADAPVFQRRAYLIVNAHAAQAWPWFQPWIERLSR